MQCNWKWPWERHVSLLTLSNGNLAIGYVPIDRFKAWFLSAAAQLEGKTPVFRSARCCVLRSQQKISIRYAGFGAGISSITSLQTDCLIHASSDKSDSFAKLKIILPDLLIAAV
jgi:hypothetical protein